jgi:hypothetical protein
MPFVDQIGRGAKMFPVEATGPSFTRRKVIFGITTPAKASEKLYARLPKGAHSE